MAELRATPLNAAHRRLGARMVAFAGWDMPLHYGSQVEEHHRVRRDAGLFDVSHMLAVDVSGADAFAAASRLLANDPAKLTRDGQVLYALMLNEEGGILDDLIVTRLARERLRLVVNAATAEEDLRWMRAQCDAAGFAARVAPRRDLAILALQGPNAARRLAQARPALDAAARLRGFEAMEFGDAFVSRTGYTGEDGFEILLPAQQAEALWNDLLDAGVAPAGLGARDSLRLEAGLPLYGQDMDAGVTPAECGLAWTVEMGHDFIGRERLRERARAVHRVGLVLLERGVLRAGQRVETAQGPGHITSGGYAPTLDGSVALARVPLGVHAGAVVRAAVRDRMLSARVVAPPFARRGRALVAVQ